MSNVAIIGAGVAGLSCACELLDRGVDVTVYERSESLGAMACSWFAGGMLAPYCEKESAEQRVVDLGGMAISWWQKHIRDVHQNGSLVLSPQRDMNQLRRFARLTEQHREVDGMQISELEPDLSGRFEQGLWFQTEAHLDPRQALQDLAEYINRYGGKLEFGESVNSLDLLASNHVDKVIDCRGFAAQEDLSRLRGVKGEMLILSSNEIQLTRPVRLLHPRYPVYLVPRDENCFMLGATMLENDERNRISALSMLELLSAAYAVHPAFGEAEIVEIGVDVRPSFDDNLPSVQRSGDVLYINGLFRHGFLLSPAMAMQTADAVMDEAQFEALPLCA